MFQHGGEAGEVKHLSGEFAEDGGEVWLVWRSLDTDRLEVGIAFQLDAAKNVTRAHEEMDIN